MGVATERAIAGVPVIVVEVPRVDVPLPVVGVPVHVHDAVCDSRTQDHPCSCLWNTR